MTQDKRSRRNADSPLPYYKWWVTDYRASRNANALPWQARGLYRELLDECWVEGAIPDDLPALAEICRCPVSIIERHWPQLRKLFVPVEGLDGVFIQSARLEKERSADDAMRVRRQNAGKLGGLAKAKQAKHLLALPSNAKHLPYSRAVAEQSSSSVPSTASGLDAAPSLPPLAETVAAMIESGMRPPRLRRTDADQR